MPKKRPEVIYYFRGEIERGRSYQWVDGWSRAGENGGVLYPWCTKREAQRAEAARGNRAVFVRAR